MRKLRKRWDKSPRVPEFNVSKRQDNKQPPLIKKACPPLGNRPNYRPVVRHGFLDPIVAGDAMM
jgi:hypothetical protein